VATTAEDTPVSGNVLGNDTDVDTGTALSVTQFTVAGLAGSFTAGQTASIANVGTLLINSNGSYTFTPALNYSGTAPVATYTLSDGTATSTATLTVGVTPVNDAPVAADDTATTAEDTPVSGNVLTNDSDVDSASLGITPFVVNGNTVAAGTTAAIPGVGTLLINTNGSYVFTPAQNYNGSVPVATYTLSDGTATSTATLAINVTSINDAPAGANDAVTTAEDTPVSGNVLANDSDVDAGTALAVTQFSVNGSTIAAGTIAAIRASARC
jgi:CshA-type fibril repeat protein